MAEKMFIGALVSTVALINTVCSALHMIGFAWRIDLYIVMACHYCALNIFPVEIHFKSNLKYCSFYNRFFY